MKILTRIIVIFVCLIFTQPSYANPFAALKGLGRLFDTISDLFHGGLSTSRVSRTTRGLKDSDDQPLYGFSGRDRYEDEKKWLTDDSACQKLEEEINKYYCMEIKDQCSKLFSSELQNSKEDPKFLFGEGHFQLSPFGNCVDQLREKFKIGILPFDEGLKNFQTFIFGTRSETSNTIDLPSSVLEFEELQQLRHKPQDIIGDRLRLSVGKILISASETNEGDLEKVWLEVESQLTEVINKLIKDAYKIDDVVANGFGNTRVPFYTQNFVNRFRGLKKSYPTIDLTELMKKDLVDLLVNDLNKLNEQIDKITGHTDPSAKTVLERLKVKREKIQEDIFNLKYSND